MTAGANSVASEGLFHRRVAETSNTEQLCNMLDFLVDHISGTREKREVPSPRPGVHPDRRRRPSWPPSAIVHPRSMLGHVFLPDNACMVHKSVKPSKVRCRPGDIAQVLRSTHNQSVGLYCQVRQSAEAAEFGPEWIVEFPREVPALSRRGMELQCRWCAMPDAWLLPLRPSDELDEVLRLVGLPQDAFTPLAR